MKGDRGMAPKKAKRKVDPKKLIIPGRITPDDTKYLRARVVLHNPGEETGAHVTDGKEEVLIVLDGVATIQFKDGKNLVRSGSAIFIAEGVEHNVRNKGHGPLRYVYVRSLSRGEKKGEHGHPHRKAHKHPAKKKKARQGARRSH
jgi:mannose-6-phosphate isomerase-like protein (cupin superfamily)